MTGVGMEAVDHHTNTPLDAIVSGQSSAETGRLTAGIMLWCRESRADTERTNGDGGHWQHVLDDTHMAHHQADRVPSCQ